MVLKDLSVENLQLPPQEMHMMIRRKRRLLSPIVVATLNLISEDGTATEDACIMYYHS